VILDVGPYAGMSKIIQSVIGGLILLLAAAAIVPNILPPRDTTPQSACVNNLRVVYVAKVRWAEIYGKSAMDIPTENDLFSEASSTAFSNGTDYPPGAFRLMPSCPVGGVILIGAMNELPRCSTGFASHSLPPAQ
jgi:hypothetical protein